MDRYEDIGGSNEGKPQRCPGNPVFLGVVISIEALGIIFVLLMTWWRSTWQGGFNWSSENHDLVFNYHPLFMSIGFVLLYSNGALVWRMFWRGNRTAVKILHGLIQLIALLFVCIGLYAAFRSHELLKEQDAAERNGTGTGTGTGTDTDTDTGTGIGTTASGAEKEKERRYHLTSLHSWAGLALVILFALQWCGGLFLFVAVYLRARPLLGTAKRITRMLHVTAGSWFIIWIGAVIFMGIMEDATDNDVYSRLTGQTWLVNIMGFALLALVTLVAYTLYKEDFKASGPSAAQDLAGNAGPTGRTEEDEHLIPLNGALSAGGASATASTSVSVTAKTDTAGMPAEQLRTSRDRLVDSAK